MKPRACFGFQVSVCAVLLLFTVPAPAQYMYLDSNGDGFHTSADQVNPAGPTTIDVWLDTQSNRDGSPAMCAETGEPYQFWLYVTCLRASGGTVDWGPYTNLQPTISALSYTRESATEFVQVNGGSPSTLPLPPGRYRLGTLLAAVSSESPQVEIVPTTALVPYETTAFGTPACLGLQFDGVIRLGEEWFDVDGLPHGSDGSANSAPSLFSIPDLPVVTGEPMSATISATDADGHALTFGKSGGPDFFSVGTLDPGNGSALGHIHAAPRAGESGTSLGTVTVSDGFSVDSKSLSIVVTPGENHAPKQERVGDLVVVAGKVSVEPLRAFDPDGNEIGFTLVSGPSYAEVTTMRSSSGGSYGQLRLAPGLCDVGMSRAVIAATDGSLADQDDVPIRVMHRMPAPATRTYETGLAAPGRDNISPLLGDTNGDGILDAVVSRFPDGIAILSGNGDGSFRLSGTETGIHTGSWSFAGDVGDFNGDGRLDFAFAQLSEPNVAVLLGRGDGTLVLGSRPGTGAAPAGVTVLDVNEDGASDLVVSNSAANSVSVLLGEGDGTFETKRDSPVGERPLGVASADFDLDGNMDVAVACEDSRALSVLLGQGSGFFRRGQDIPLVGTPMPSLVSVAACDLNRDGVPDLVVCDFGIVSPNSCRMYILLGRGDGTFQVGELLVPGTNLAQQATVLDWNADGSVDLAVAANPNFILIGRGDGTFEAPLLLTQHSANGMAAGDLNQDGFQDLVMTDPSRLLSFMNQTGGTGDPLIRVLLPDERRTLPAGGPHVCLRLESGTESYDISYLDHSTLILRSEGTGSVSQISCVSKSLTRGDTDRNGVAELPACFARSDFARLFDRIQGRQTVTAYLEGAFVHGSRFCSPVGLNVVGTGGPLAASVSPNPLNPQGVLRFSTPREGAVRVRLFDIHGRVVRTVLQHPLMPAGDHEVPIDGRAQNGQTLASGVYFYEVEAAGETLKGRFTVLK